MSEKLNDEARLNAILYAWETRMPSMPFVPSLQEQLLALCRDLVREENEAAERIARDEAAVWEQDGAMDGVHSANNIADRIAARRRTTA